MGVYEFYVWGVIASIICLLTTAGVNTLILKSQFAGNLSSIGLVFDFRSGQILPQRRNEGPLRFWLHQVSWAGLSWITVCFFLSGLYAGVSFYLSLSGRERKHLFKLLNDKLNPTDVEESFRLVFPETEFSQPDDRQDIRVVHFRPMNSSDNLENKTSGSTALRAKL